MKKNKQILLSVLIGICFIAFAHSQVVAGENGHGGPKGENGHGGIKGKNGCHKKKAILEKFDKDGDGKLSKEEHQAAREARRKRMLEKFDKDGDGKLSEEERAAAKKFHQERKRKHHGPKRKKRDGNQDDGIGDAVTAPVE